MSGKCCRRRKSGICRRGKYSNGGYSIYVPKTKCVSAGIGQSGGLTDAQFILYFNADEMRSVPAIVLSLLQSRSWHRRYPLQTFPSDTIFGAVSLLTFWVACLRLPLAASLFPVQYRFSGYILRQTNVIIMFTTSCSLASRYSFKIFLSL